MVASKFNKCMARKLRGKHFRTREGQNKAFRGALRACGAKRHPHKTGGKRKTHKRCSIKGMKKCQKACVRRYGHCRA